MEDKKELETLEAKAEGLISLFREEYLKAVQHYAKSGAVAEEDLDFIFLKCVLVLTAENYNFDRVEKFNEMLKNLRHI